MHDRQSGRQNAQDQHEAIDELTSGNIAAARRHHTPSLQELK